MNSNPRTVHGNRPIARWLAIGLGLLAAAAPAFAARPKDPAGALDQKEFFRPDLYISTSHERLDAVLGALPNKGAWEEFVASRGAAVAAYIDPRSGAASNIIAVTFGLVLYGL